ncbi:hypothetical protein EMIT0P253_270015 [Pseudomonas sp. IT-P253]
MLQKLGEQFGEQATQWPLRAVLEAGDQTVYRKAVKPGRGDTFEGRRLLQALTTGEPRRGQGQGTGLAVVA